VGDIVARAKALCARKAIRWTAPREQVLTVLAQADAPLTAYAILDKVSIDYQRITNAPSVYRALETLCDIGVVLSVGSTGRYMVCHHPDDQATHLFLVCRCCGHVHELHLDALDKTIDQQLQATGFTAQKQVIEVQGLCQACQDHK
jgi:Fur family zinc uptake transcriptional regulator